MIHARPPASDLRSPKNNIVSTDMSDATLDLKARLAHQRSLYDCMEVVLGKLQHDRASITTAGAQALAEVARDGDTQMAIVVAALRDLAPRNGSSEGAPPRGKDCTPASRLSQLVDDLHTTVVANPGDVTPRTIQSMQSILDTMQKAIVHTQAPHPELQAEIQQQYARIVPKIEATTASNAGYSDLHPPKKQANGRIMPNGSDITAHSTSVDCGQQTFTNGESQVAQETTDREEATDEEAAESKETLQKRPWQTTQTAAEDASDGKTANKLPRKGAAQTEIKDNERKIDKTRCGCDEEQILKKAEGKNTAANSHHDQLTA